MRRPQIMIWEQGKKWTLHFRCVGIPTHIKQQNNNNNIKEITLHMSSPPKIWGKSLHF